jgi:2-keto-3-deoxy-galactonokinase
MSRLVAGSKAAILPGTHGSWVAALETGPGNTWKAKITAQLIHQFLSE